MQHNQASKSTLTDKQKFELCQYARDNRQEIDHNFKIEVSLVTLNSKSGIAKRHEVNTLT